MADFLLTENTATANADNIVVSWVGAPITKEHSIVIYRSRFPVFEAAEDIIEVETTASGIYTDTTVEADQEYYYWLVDTDHDVEVATTGMLNAKLTTALLSPQEPEQGSPIALFIPFVNR